MTPEKSLESFPRFAMEQYKTETKVWVYLFILLSVVFGVSPLASGLSYGATGLFDHWPLTVLMMGAGLFLCLYAIRIVSLFTWYFIIFWLLTWFPSIRKEKFDAA